MKPRHIVGLVLLTVATMALIFGTCTVVILYNGLGANQGPKHRFPLAGDVPLTEAQALDISKQVMALDGKLSSMLRPTSFGNDAAGAKTYINRQPNSTDITVCWYEPISG